MSFYNHSNQRLIIRPFFPLFKVDVSISTGSIAQGARPLRGLSAKSVLGAIRALVDYQMILDGTSLTFR